MPHQDSTRLVVLIALIAAVGLCVIVGGIFLWSQAVHSVEDTRRLRTLPIIHPKGATLQCDGWPSYIALTVQQPRVETDSRFPITVFTIDVELRNTSTNRLVTYSAWSRGGGMLDRPPASIDNFGNRYSLYVFPRNFDSDSLDDFGSGTIYPGKSLTDTIRFLPPVNTFEWIELTLPDPFAGNHAAETITLRIPQTAITIEK